MSAGRSQHGREDHDARAAAVIVSLPVIAIYVLLQRNLIEGILSGAIKE